MQLIQLLVKICCPLFSRTWWGREIKGHENFGFYSKWCTPRCGYSPHRRWANSVNR